MCTDIMQRDNAQPGLLCMQAATAGTSVIGQSAPQAGDCFTYEHLADRNHLWLDFCADTGDGGDSTYAVARAMATPILQVKHQSVTSLPCAAIQAAATCMGHGSP